MASYRLHYAPDNASLIVRLALEEMGLGYETVLVDRSVREQRSASYLALNPAGRIPTLETPDGPISETGAILLWLADRHGQLAPAPRDTARGAFLNWLFFVSNTLHADAVQYFYIHRYGPEAAWPAMRAALRKRIGRHLAVLETQATGRLTGWFCGPDPSLLDLYVAAILRWLQLYPAGQADWLSLATYPKLGESCALLDARESTVALCAAEGLSARPFSAPRPPVPPEGTVT